MQKGIYETILGERIDVIFDDLQIEVIDIVDHSVFYKCTGYDIEGRQYEGTSEFCCNEFEAIADVERVSYMRHNKKPYQARILLKSIKYWKSVINGESPVKRPIAYYKNKLSNYTQIDINYLEEVSRINN